MRASLKKKVASLPLKPGVYLYKNSANDIIYVGKAKQLKKRVSSYFSKRHTDKTALLVRDIADLDFVVTDNGSPTTEELGYILFSTNFLYSAYKGAIILKKSP